jgi:hypothetical protein
MSHAILHTDGRYFCGWSPSRSRRAIWSNDPRRAWLADETEMRRSIGVMARHKMPVRPDPVEVAE